MDPVSVPDINAAMAETKAWLRIETGADDGAIAALVRAAITHAESFCAQTLIVRAGVEIMPAAYEWARIGTCPIVSVQHVASVALDGTRTVLATSAYSVDIDGRGDGWIRVMQAIAARRVEVDFTAGMAADWASLPDALRQGVVRLAAHMFAERESDAPPAIVTALWRPWRRMRLA